MAFILQLLTQDSGDRSKADLQGLQVYLIFFRSDSFMKATGISRKGSLGSSSRTSKRSPGQAGTQSPQPLHRSVSMLMKNSPEPSLYPKLAIISNPMASCKLLVTGKKSLAINQLKNQNPQLVTRNSFFTSPFPPGPGQAGPPRRRRRSERQTLELRP